MTGDELAQVGAQIYDSAPGKLVFGRQVIIMVRDGMSIGLYSVGLSSEERRELVTFLRDAASQLEGN